MFKKRGWARQKSDRLGCPNFFTFLVVVDVGWLVGWMVVAMLHHQIYNALRFLYEKKLILQSSSS